eukprot:maker-scaffold237_size242172-snap-gene-0.19 protein:Tk05165 transcript:maker-scaffold237_size242172-snap-gene-0.19-mRNA-1 annotation:"arrestin domain-containing protein 3-like"
MVNTSHTHTSWHGQHPMLRASKPPGTIQKIRGTLIAILTAVGTTIRGALSHLTASCGSLQGLECVRQDIMGVDKLDILFDRDREIYKAGDAVVGKVLVVVSGGPITVQDIKLKWKGRAKVSYKVTTGAGQTRNTTYYKKEEIYFNSYESLLNNATEKVLNDGEHTFPIQCVLPLDLPYSVREGYSNTRYSAKLTVSIPFSLDKKKKRTFLVAAKVDLNLMPEAMKPMEIREEKKLKSLLSQHGPLTGTLRLPHSGYVPGESIVAKLCVENRSNARIKCTDLKFIQKITVIGSHHGRDRPSVTQRTLAQVPGPSVKPCDLASWSSDLLVVPQVSPTLTNLCGIIHVEYFLQAFRWTAFQLNGTIGDNECPNRYFNPSEYPILPLSIAKIYLVPVF